MKFELDYIEKLVNLISNSELTELALEDGERAIVLRKDKESVTTAALSAPSSVVSTVPVIEVPFMSSFRVRF